MYLPMCVILINLSECDQNTILTPKLNLFKVWFKILIALIC